MNVRKSIKQWNKIFNYDLDEIDERIFSDLVDNWPELIDTLLKESKVVFVSLKQPKMPTTFFDKAKKFFGVKKDEELSCSKEELIVRLKACRERLKDELEKDRRKQNMANHPDVIANDENYLERLDDFIKRVGRSQHPAPSKKVHLPTSTLKGVNSQSLSNEQQKKSTGCCISRLFGFFNRKQPEKQATPKNQAVIYGNARSGYVIVR